MCGIIGILHAQPSEISVASELHEALHLLQHRGQDACVSSRIASSNLGSGMCRGTCLKSILLFGHILQNHVIPS